MKISQKAVSSDSSWIISAHMRNIRNIWFTEYMIHCLTWSLSFNSLLSLLLFGALFLKFAWVPMIELFYTENFEYKKKSDAELSKLRALTPHSFFIKVNWPLSLLPSDNPHNCSNRLRDKLNNSMPFISSNCLQTLQVK